MKTPVRAFFAIAFIVAMGVLWLLVRPSPPKAVVAPAAQPRVVKKDSSAIPSAKPEPPPAPRLPDLTPAQQRTVDDWLQRHRDWRSLNAFAPFNELHMSAFQSLRRDDGWKHRLKQAASLARMAQGDATATPENTAVVFNFEQIFRDEQDRRLYASALVAGDRQAVEEVYISRMWAIAAEQHFRSEATQSGGLNPIPMTDELREELRKELAKDPAP
ncbi:MAG: hypothetical protein JNG86_13280 [Verrucomicrobiaceae bacterium]|nr:hypothetical protein [Verrucomicrobiaceae bacterium]